MQIKYGYIVVIQGLIILVVTIVILQVWKFARCEFDESVSCPVASW